MKDFFKQVGNFFATSGWTVVIFLATLVFGIIIVRLITLLIRKILLKGSMNKTLAGFLLTAVKFFLYIILFFILADIAGIALTPLITAFGAGALAVGLALKDSLSNVANGVLILGTKPFKVGDYVEIDGIGGTVKAIRMITVELLTPDNKKITIPNSTVTSSNIINFSARPTRRVDFTFDVSYDSDTDKVKEILLAAASKHPKIMQEPAPVVKLNKMDSSSLQFILRAWVNGADYWEVFWDINEDIFKEFKAAAIEIPFNQLDVHLKNDKEDN